MTGIPNDHSPGQLDLVPLDLTEQEARVRAELDRLAALRVERHAHAVDRVRSLAAHHGETTLALDQAVAEARAAGCTWQQIADAVGVVRSAAWERWAHRG